MSLNSIADYKDLKGADALTTAEIALIEATRAGKGCHLGKNVPTTPTDANTIRSEVLRLLILGGTPRCRLPEKGVRLSGGWITGCLDLACCTVKGEIDLNACHFEAQPSFQLASLRLLSLKHSKLPGLKAQGVKIDGDLRLRDIIATRTVNVQGAVIGGQFDCTSATFESTKRIEDPSTVDRTTAPSFATIEEALGGQTNWKDPAINYQDYNALNAQAANVGDSMVLRGVTATGIVALSRAKIGGDLNCHDATFDGARLPALRADRVTVAASLLFRRVTVKRGHINLASARIGELADDPTSWPVTCGALILAGFTYDRIAAKSAVMLSDRQQWLADGSVWKGEFYPQPYTQFAKVLRAMGHASEARSVLIKRETLLAQHRFSPERLAHEKAMAGGPGSKGGSLWIWLRMMLARFWSWILGCITGFGYAPQRALICFLVSVGISFFFYLLFWCKGAMVPNSAILLATPDWAAAVAANPTAPSHAWSGPAASHFETFYALTYAIDVFLPIIDLGQQSAWSQTTVTWWGWAARIYTWALQAVGFVVTTLGVAAATGILQRTQPD